LELITIKKACDDTPKLSIIVVTKNFDNEFVKELLDSMHVITLKFEVILIVTQMEKAGTVKEFLREHSTKNLNLIRVLALSLDSDMGLTFGRNLGVALAGSDTLVFSDDDILLVEDISPLINYLESNFCQGVQPLILSFSNPNIIDSAGDQIRQCRGVYHVTIRGNGQNLSLLGERFVADQLPSMRGAFMVLRKDALIAIGGFDNSFFFNLDDVDIGWRMTLAGYKIMFVPTIKVLHRGGRTTNSALIDERVYRYSIVNYHALQLKMLSYFAWPYIIGRFLVYAAGHEIRQYQRGNMDALSLIEGFLLMNKMLTQRFKYIMLHRKILRNRFNLCGIQTFKAMANGNQLFTTSLRFSTE
jgi:GT2 family glycosyltransferase